MLEEILGDFSLSDESPAAGERKAVTLWLSKEDWARYERLQERSRKKFSKAAKRGLLALMELAEKKAS